MVVATRTKFSHVLQQSITFQIQKSVTKFPTILDSF